MSLFTETVVRLIVYCDSPIPPHERTGCTGCVEVEGDSLSAARKSIRSALTGWTVTGCGREQRHLCPSCKGHRGR